MTVFHGSLRDRHWFLVGHFSSSLYPYLTNLCVSLSLPPLSFSLSFIFSGSSWILAEFHNWNISFFPCGARVFDQGHESTSCYPLYLAILEKKTSWSLFDVELHRSGTRFRWLSCLWIDEKVEFDVRIELEACVHSRSDVSKARIFVSFRCGLFVAFSGDLGRLVKPYFIEGYCYGNNFSLYRLIYPFIKCVKLEYDRYCVMTFCYSIFCRDNRYQYCYFFFHSLCKI